MTATMYFTLFIVLAVFNCNAQILPGGVPIFHGGFLRQPLNLQNSFNAVPGPVGVSQKIFTRVPVMPSLSHRAPMTALKLGSLPGLGMIPMNPLGVNISPLQLRSTDAKENVKDQNAANAELAVEKKIEAILEKMKKETPKPAEQPKGKAADSSIDPVDQETDEIPKQVLGASGSFSDDGRSPVPPKTRSPENGEGIPDLDYLSKAANPIDDFGKKVEKTAKTIGQEIKHVFTNIPKLFQGRAEGRQNTEGSSPYNNGQSESSQIVKEPVTSSGLQKAMDDFQKTLAKSQLMQKYYGNQKSDGYYGNQHSSDVYSNAKETDSTGKYYINQKPNGYYENQHNSNVYSHGKEADSAGYFWDSAAGVAKNVADSLIKGVQSRTEQTESGSSSGSRQENNPMSTLFDSASKSAGKFADDMQNYGNTGYKEPNYENGIPAHIWKAVSEYVGKHAKNFANPEQQDNNEFLGTLHRQYGYGFGGYPGYYGNEYHGHQQHHGHHEHHGHGPQYPHYSSSYQNGYYPRPGWQYGNGYYKRSPVEVENSTASRNSRGLPLASDSAADVAETVFDLVRGIMDGNPHQIAHASVDMGAGIADATSDSDMYKRTIEENSKNSTSARNARQMPQTSQPTQSGDITNSAIMLAQSILARRPDQIANAGVNLGSGIAGIANGGQRFFKRSDSVEPEDSSLSRSPRQMLPGLMSPVQIGLASTALNFAQGFVGANPKQGVIQPIVGGFGTSAGNLVHGLGLMHNQPSTIHGIPINQLGQIVSSAVNLAQGITGAANNPGAQPPRYFKRSDSAVNDPSTRMSRQIPLFSQGLGHPAGTITHSALKLAQSILSRNPGQIAKSGINMGTGIAGTRLENPTQGLPTNQFGQIAGSAMNLAQGIVSNSPDQIVNSGVNMGSGIATSRFFKRSDSTESQNATTTRNLRQIPLLSQGWVQPAGTVTNSALTLAQGILNGNPAQIANSGVNMGTGIAGATNGAVFYRPRFFKRSSEGSIWQSATGLAGSIASSANVDPSRIGTQDVMGIAVGAIKEGGSASPSDIVWESISDLAGSIDKVTEKPSLLAKALTISNSPVKTIIKSPNQLTNIGHNQNLGAPNPSGEIVNSATTLAGRIASILMNPNVFNNPNLDATDGKSANPLLTPVYLAGDIVGVALNPEAYRNVRMLQSYAPTQTGGYVQTNVPAAVPTSPQQQSSTS